MGIELFQVSKSYDFAEVQVIIGGLRIGGFGDDGGVSIEPQSDLASMKMGADGEVTVSKLPQPFWIATITLMETSLSNTVLEGLLVAQRALPAGFILPFALLDGETGESLLSGQCIFLAWPTIGKEREAGTREWKLGIPKAAAVFAQLPASLLP